MKFWLRIAFFCFASLVIAADVEFREDENGYPTWDVPKHMPKDVFTFCRVQYNSSRHDSWRIDFPDADKNISFRLQQLTSMRSTLPPQAAACSTAKNSPNIPFSTWSSPAA